MSRTIEVSEETYEPKTVREIFHQMCIDAGGEGFINEAIDKAMPKLRTLIESKRPEKQELEFDCLGNPMGSNKKKEGFNACLDKLAENEKELWV